MLTNPQHSYKAIPSMPFLASDHSPSTHGKENTMEINFDQFVTTIEVVPPHGPDAAPLMASLESVKDLPIKGFSVATNPVAKPRMDAMATCLLAQQRTGLPAILHCTTRDHNVLSLKGLLWGAKALGINTVMAATGDFVALGDRATTTTVRDTDVFGLVTMARAAGLTTGVVLDPDAGKGGFATAVARLRKKVDAGAQFAVTQPVYDRPFAQKIAEATRDLGIPVILGILPLRTFRHAEFLHQKVAGISVPGALRKKMAQASDTIAEGVLNAREMLAIAKEGFGGACIMPPFDHYEVMPDILK